ncbi:MAG: patatin-like phospholipase family protein [Treponema sp.]|nr:patatin-like phospholipase family protein [Treponema sp.]
MKKVVSIFSVIIFSAVLFARPKVCVVLSGGAARGFAEIPILEALEDEGIPVDMVVGTSFGAIIGSLYCSGYTPRQITKILLETDYLGLLNKKAVEPETLPPKATGPREDSYFQFAFSKNGIGSTAGVLGDENILLLLNHYLSRVMTVTDFDNLEVPFRAVATDAASGKTVVLDSGSICSAVRASMSLPMVWSPYPIDDKVYFDGGLRKNLPIDVAKDLGADIIIAMDVMGNVTCEPSQIDDLYDSSMQFINLVISNNSSEQYRYADLVLTPDLSRFNIADFIHVQDIMNAGQDCIEQNREALHQIALKLQNEGVELNPKSYNRKGTYEQLPDMEIEKIEIKDISLVGDFVLPRAEEFKNLIGKKLDDETKTYLSEKLENLQNVYHLTSLTYYAKKGSEEGKIVLEIQANHYYKKAHHFFAGGDNQIQIGLTDKNALTRFIPVPDITAGFYLAFPVEIIGVAELANTTRLSLSVLPNLYEFPKGTKLKQENEIGFIYGSLNPASHLINKDRTVCDDNGFYSKVGMQISYVDLINIRGGLEYQTAWFKNNSKSLSTLELYSEYVFDNMGNPFTSLSGIKVSLLGKYGFNLNEISNNGFSQCFIAELKSGVIVPIVKNRFSLGCEFLFGVNRFPYEMNNGYLEYGGLNGMCGVPSGALQRDYSIGGFSAHIKITEIAGMPLFGTFKAKIGFRDGYRPFSETVAPDNSFFSGFSQAETGLGLYAGLKLPAGNLILGGSYNWNGQWVITLAYN